LIELEYGIESILPMKRAEVLEKLCIFGNKHREDLLK